MIIIFLKIMIFISIFLITRFFIIKILAKILEIKLNQN